jgi:hexosaminidase
MAPAPSPKLPPLLPHPRHAVARPGRLALRDGLPIVLDAGSDERDFGAACALRDAVRAASGVRLPVETHLRRDDLGPHVALRREADAGDAYRLRVGADGAEVLAAGGPGLRYGAETLGQLVDRRGALPACEIDDAPDLPRRGIMLDVSRGKVPTEATLRDLVDLCVRLKLNVLMLYVEHTFRFRHHPRIGADAFGLEAETLRGLDAYAAERHVELVPNLQSLGHMEHVLRLPEYAALAETDARWTLACADPASYELLSDLYEEYLPNFRSRLFHANCDEPWDLGRGRSKELADALGPGGLFLEHVRRVRDLARAQGRRTLVWADFVHAHPEHLSAIDPDLVLCDWWYEAECDYDRVGAFARRGLEFWVCPGTSSWNCLFPRMENALLNITRWADAGRRHGASGLLVTDWGDFGHYNALGASWLAYAWAAQQAWSGEVAAASFDRAFGRVLFGDASGEAARLYRELGALHEAGFRVFNASPIQFLFFDDLDAAWFVRGVAPRAARRTLARLERLRARLAGAEDRFGADAVTHAELAWAADASIHALRKAFAGRRYVAWRERPGSLDTRTRRALSRELARLAAEQRGLGARLRRLWLARSRPSNFEITGRRLARSLASLRRAARALASGRPPPPPPPHEGFSTAAVFQHLKEVARAG